MEAIMALDELKTLLSRSLEARNDLLTAEEANAVRLYSGFYEGYPGLAVDLYGQTLVLFDHRETMSALDDWMDSVQQFYLQNLPQINCVVRKSRNSPDPVQKTGIVTYGEQPVDRVAEHGVQYAVDLMLNQDASFYIDTRNLREWLIDHSRGCDVLNTFAYTGTLGVAALAGGARTVLQTDRNRSFLAIARSSCMYSRLDLGRMKLRAADFFIEVSQLKKHGDLFDLVLLDPPFFSVTEKGVVEQQHQSARLINKSRPLVRHNGRIVSVNNSLFLSGEAYLKTLEEICADGYLEIEEIIPIPEDVTGYPGTIQGAPPVPTQPFNHPTKIVILRVSRK